MNLAQTERSFKSRACSRHGSAGASGPVGMVRCMIRSTGGGSSSRPQGATRSEALPDAKAPAAVHRGDPHGSKSDAQAAKPALPAIQAITRERLLVPADFR